MFLFHVQLAVHDAGADAEYKSNNMHSAVIQHKQETRLAGWNWLFVVLLTQSQQRQWLVWDHGYAATTAAMLLLLLLRTLSFLPCIEYALMQRKSKEKRAKGRKRTRFASALHPSVQRGIHIHLAATTPQKNAFP